ncbi:DUF2247 family protein [Rhodococcus sp. ARC_M6]|uniref:DUF2247 family protein n=1 Tax=Rhodococcus sp. ARC_M6 TaxID=2928852 RepID=UPI001FB371BB|nr:DUF2247 family protein [Rhodococcus sp. ARC_M6]MCJ0906509.1 DUF2247 family protein [Rhodococcus sp. ARC_M6]
MSETLVKFHIPADFVIEYAKLYSDELKWGYFNGWIDRRDAIAIMLHALVNGVRLSEDEERLALLLSVEAASVDDILEKIEFSSGEIESRRVWLYLALAWAFAHKDDFLDPFEVVECIYADFQYPSEIDNIIRYMPPRVGEAPGGIPGIEQAWESYVREMKEFYLNRD